MYRFTELFLVSTFLVGILNANQLREWDRCTLNIPPALRSTAIQELQVKVNNHKSLWFWPRGQNAETWSFMWKDMGASNDILELLIKPTSGVVSKFEGSFKIDSVSVSCYGITNFGRVDVYANRFCPRSNPVEIKLDKEIAFLPCQ